MDIPEDELEIDPDQVHEIMENEPEKIFVIDVREPWEFVSNSGHVKGAVNIPMNDIPDKLDFMKQLEGKIIALICHSGERSYYACQFLRDSEIKSAFSVRGGIMKWLRNGHDVEFE